MQPTRAGILVLCTGNSARSQMAAGYLEQYVGDRYAVESAGTEPAAEVHPLAVEAMAEVGISIRDTPKDYRAVIGRMNPEHVIVVCDGAAQACPAAATGPAERLHWPFEDPAAATGSAEAKLSKFREVRDQIDRKILSWIETLP